MSIEFDIARRYLFAKKSQNVINIISIISAMGVMVATAALIIVLSVFNGLNGLVQSLFGSFDPDLKIEASRGKTFAADSLLRTRIGGTEGVAAFSVVVADNALIKYSKRQTPAVVMGVDEAYGLVTDIDSIMLEGSFRPGHCVLGVALADQLGVASTSFVPTVSVFAPRRVGKINMQNPEKSFVERLTKISGIFMVKQVEYDSQYALVGLKTARELFCYYGDEATSVCVRVAEGHDAKEVGSRLQKSLGEGLTVKDKWQQHESFFKMMEVEKLMSFFILLFIVLIAAFNIIGSLSMLIFEKKESISVLRSMGADESTVTRIFLYEGWLVSIGGALLGLVLGVALVMAQERWGIVSFGNSADYIISAYPVELQWGDVAMVFVAVIALAALAAYYPVKTIVSKYYRDKA